KADGETPGPAPELRRQEEREEREQRAARGEHALALDVVEGPSQIALRKRHRRRRDGDEPEQQQRADRAEQHGIEGIARWTRRRVHAAWLRTARANWSPRSA